MKIVIRYSLEDRVIEMTLPVIKNSEEFVKLVEKIQNY